MMMPPGCCIIHRAILGSVERCSAILTEHFGGKWPLWLYASIFGLLSMGRCEKENLALDRTLYDCTVSGECAATLFPRARISTNMDRIWTRYR